MNFIENYRKKNLLKKINENNIRKKSFHYIEDSKKIAFIINSDNKKILEIYSNYVKDLKNQDKNISELFVTNVKTKKEEILPKDTISFADKKWNHNETLKKFVSEHYDILITVFENMVFKTQYLSAMISADLKISPNYSDFNTADITFLVEEQNFIEFFNAINQYVSKK